MGKNYNIRILKSFFLTLLSMAGLMAPVLTGFAPWPTDPIIIFGLFSIFIWSLNEFFSPANYSRNEIREFKSLFFMTFSQPSAVVVPCFTYFLLGPTIPGSLVISIAAVFLVILGGGIRWVAMRTLGNFYTMCVTIRESHSVISHGIYRFIRHPGYLGQFCFLLGIVLLFRSFFGLLVYFIWGVTQIYRINREEKILTTHLTAYSEYQQKTKRLVPGLY